MNELWKTYVQALKDNDDTLADHVLSQIMYLNNNF